MTVETDKQYLWVEKYRPKTIEECILPDSIKQSFRDMLSHEESQNLLLSGGAGVGKTTIARALCTELNADYLLLNCSEEGGIDTLRVKIRNFASTVSLSGGKKIVILDEFDYANANSMQPALRGFIEEFSDNCRFILTCNFKNRIIEPIHSRCTCIDFRFNETDKRKMCVAFMDRAKYILEAEGVSYDERVLAKLILKHSPDWRRTLNELQRYSVGGEIDVGILNEIGDLKISDLVSHLKTKEYNKVREWVVNNLSNDTAQILRKIYDSLYERMQPQSIPAAVLIIAEYQYKSAFVADQEINLLACLTEIMMECQFK